MFYHTTLRSPVGELTLTCNDKQQLTALLIAGQKYFCDMPQGEWVGRNDLAIFNRVSVWLDIYFNGANPDTSSLPLSPAGSAFRQRVWSILRSIPYGTTTTYGAIAQQIATETGRLRMSAQAVGGAVGHNPISIIIPCHRVIGADGSLTGYAGGLQIKDKLLRLEGLSK
ncbi:MAG: methylated-DNA--[protein]-cysteine S-methyltransferase [Prevotellaceae bacterium]|jgi:methylated-DNA-[protein]-cysteine S-methyltransferase|nr:methylated-DNA--[protein]-cysteine S-methyltransferase [Prevotellaceae bacterium]